MPRIWLIAESYGIHLVFPKKLPNHARAPVHRPWAMYEWLCFLRVHVTLSLFFKLATLISDILSWIILICIYLVTSLEKAMAPHSSTPAWTIPWMEEPGRPQSVGSLRFGHNWTTSLSLFAFMPWRRKWQATPVFLPGESQGWRSLVSCCLWGRTESDTTEATQQQQQ